MREQKRMLSYTDISKTGIGSGVHKKDVAVRDVGQNQESITEAKGEEHFQKES